MVGHCIRVRDVFNKKEKAEKKKPNTTEFGKTILYVCVLLLWTFSSLVQWRGTLLQPNSSVSVKNTDLITSELKPNT